MRPIPNQPFIFTGANDISPFPSDYRRNDDDPGEPVKIFNTDTIYLQFDREVTELPIKPDLIDPILAINLVQDPTFDQPTMWEWNPVLGWTISGGKAIHTGAGPDTMSIAVPITSGLYVLEYTITSISGTVTPYLGSVDPGNAGAARVTTGTFKETIERTSGLFQYLVFSAAGDATIDNVSLYRLVDGDPGTPINGWDWDTNDWEYSGSGITHLTGNNGVLHFNGLTAGKHYRICLEFEPSEFGYFSIYEAANFIAVADSDRQYYYFKATGTEVTIKPSDEFTGKITSMYLQEVDSFDALRQIIWYSETDASSTDVSDYVVYDDAFATLVLTPDDYGSDDLDIPLGCGHFKFVVDKDGEVSDDETIYFSNKFKLQEPEDGYLLFKGYQPCTGYGFDFRTFRLQHRVKVEFSNPTFPWTKVQQVGSDGTKKIVFGQRDKLWRVKTEHIDEAAHSCISLIMALQNFTIDDRQYFWEDRNYSISWAENGENLTAAAIFQLSDIQSVVFGRNESCTSSGYIMKVLYGWDAYTSFKQLDKFNVALNDTMTIRVEKILINGVNQLVTPQYLNINRDSLGVYSPDLDLADGINENWSDALGASVFVQNADAFINSLITGEELRFYDALSIAQYVPGTEFVVDIGLRYSSYSTAWVRRRYTNDGMALLDSSETPVLQYV